MTKIIARLGAILGLESQEFVKGVNEAQQKSKEFKKNLRELKETTDQIKTSFNLAGAAFLGFAAHAIIAADEIQDLADANETTTGRILELRHALELSGGDANKISVLFTKFTGAVNDAAQGSDKLRDSFKAVGISTKDLGILSNDQLQNKAFAGLSKIEDSVRRNAIAAELFGKAAKSVDFKTLADNAEKLAGHYKDQEAALKAAADAAQKVKTLFHDMEMAALLAIKPVVDLFNKIPTEDKINAMTKAFQALGIAIGVAFGVSAVSGVIKLGKALAIVRASNPWLSALGMLGAGMAAYGAADAFLGLEETAPKGNAPKDEANQTKRDIELSARDKIILKYKEQIKQVSELARLEQARIFNAMTYDVKELELQDKRSVLSTQEFERAKLKIDYEKQRLAILEKTDKAIYDAQKQMELAPAEEHQMAKKLYDEKIKWINKTKDYEMFALESVNEQRTKNLENEYERQRSWAAGWNEAFKNYQEAAERASDRGREAFNSVMNNMENALKTFVETGKINFKSLISSIVKDLLYAQMRAQATALFGMLKSFVGFGGSSPNAPIEDRSIISGFASGGFMNGPSIVGENGPELFIPSTPGTVIPNGSWQQMASRGGGMTVNGPYIANLSTIDSKSFEDRIYQSNKAIWAAGKYAEKSLAASGGRS